MTSVEFNSEDKLEWKYKFTHDSEGKLILHTKHNPDGTVRWNNVYKYNSDGNKTEEILSNSDGEYTFRYDSKGNRIEWNKFHPNGELDWKFNYKVNSDGEIIEQIKYDTEKNTKQKLELKYDSDKNMTEWLQTKDEVLQEIGNLKYDSNRNTTEWILKNSDGSIKLKKTFKYDSDSQGNWIKRTVFDRSNAITKVEDITERVIEYY